MQLTDSSSNVVRDISNNILMNRYNLSQPTPLIYPDISGINQYTNILLIENAVPDYQKVVDSVNASTLPIVYSIRSKKSDLLALLRAKFTTIPRIGFFFSSSSGRTKLFLDKEPLFVDDETVPYSENVQFILNVITEFQVQNIDYLACDTLNYPNWENYYAVLTGSGVTVCASNDKTGNIKYGGDWVLESTSQDVESVYFTQSVEYYTYLLDNPTWATVYNCNYIVCDNNGYLYVSTFNTNTIVKVPINNPGGATTWVSSGLSFAFGMCIYQDYLYIASYLDSKIIKINLSDATYSTFATSTQGVNNPRCLVTDGTYMYVSNSGSIICRILLSDPNTYVDSWATSAQGLFNVFGLAIYNGYLYVSSLGDYPTYISFISRILLSDPNTYITSWATSTQGLSSTRDLLIYNGYIYATNSSLSTISQISLTYPNSDYNATWATSSNGLNYPLSIARDDTYFYVCNYAGNDNTIAQISLPPFHWAVLADAPAATCTSMVIDNSGMYMYVSSFANNGEIGRISLTNPSTDNTVWASYAIQGFKDPQQMVIYNGYLYVACNNDSSEHYYISKISLTNPTGEYNTYWVNMIDIDQYSFPQPRGLAIYNGLLFVSCWSGYNNGGSVDIINLSNPSDYNNNWFNGGTVAGFNASPEVLTIAYGYLYISFNDGEICQIPIAGFSAPASTIPSPPDAMNLYFNPWVPYSQGLNSPTYMTILGNYMYVANQGGTTISKISLDNPTTDYNNNWATSSQGVNHPSGIATDRKSIYFGNASDSSIFQINKFKTAECKIRGTGRITGKGSLLTLNLYPNSNPY